MTAQRRSEGALGAGSAGSHPSHGINSEPASLPGRPAALPDDGLYRYVPVPPVYRDEDGYPIEDGMSQTINHQAQTSHWRMALQRHCRTATVASDLTMPYERGDTTKVLVPDLFVALRAERLRDRRSYRLWENPLPELVMEMLSDTTAEADVGSKRNTYEYLGIREYWLFDPEGFELATPLVGYRLRDRRYRPIEAAGAGRLHSEVLGLDLHVRDGELRFRDPATGENLSTYDEAEDRRVAAKLRADEEKRRAEKHRADAAKEKRRAEKYRADAAEKAREAEKRRADAAERELARLRSRLNEQ